MPATVRKGIARTSRKLVTRTLQVNSVMRKKVMPGARSEKIVTIMLSAPKIEENPSTVRARIRRSTPGPGENSRVELGT